MKDAVNEVYEFVALMSDNDWRYLGKFTDTFSAEREAKEMSEHIGLTVKKVITNDEYEKMVREERIEELTSKIPDAIKVFKELCSMFEDGCSGCPLDKNGSCVVRLKPFQWQFEESEDEEDG